MSTYGIESVQPVKSLHRSQVINPPQAPTRNAERMSIPQCGEASGYLFFSCNCTKYLRCHVRSNRVILLHGPATFKPGRRWCHAASHAMYMPPLAKRHKDSQGICTWSTPHFASRTTQPAEPPFHRHNRGSLLANGGVICAQIH